MFGVKKEKFSKAELERGKGILNSLVIIVNVLYAFLIFDLFSMLPSPEDSKLNFGTLSKGYSDHLMVLASLFIGLLMIVVYWIQFNRQLGNLVKSSPIHAALTIFQMSCLMLYLYFLR